MCKANLRCNRGIVATAELFDTSHGYNVIIWYMEKYALNTANFAVPTLQTTI